jgi:hypothetical protein
MRGAILQFSLTPSYHGDYLSTELTLSLYVDCHISYHKVLMSDGLQVLTVEKSKL